MKLNFCLLLALTLFLNCTNKEPYTANKTVVLLADREQKVGWVYLSLYEDDTFGLKIRRKGQTLGGGFRIVKDTLFLDYEGRVDPLRTKAILSDIRICFLNDSIQQKTKKSCSEILDIRMNEMRRK